MMIFGGHSNKPLVKGICEYLNIPEGRVKLSRFANGEIDVKFLDGVRGQDVYILQSGANYIYEGRYYSVNDAIIQHLIMCDAARRASASTINAILPVFGYQRQEKKTKGREPISAKLVADLYGVVGIRRVVTIHLHASAIMGFFHCPVDNLSIDPLIIKEIGKIKMEHGLKCNENAKMTFIGPDAGSVKMMENYTGYYPGSKKGVIFKTRPKKDKNEVSIVVAEKIEGQIVIIIDDITTTGGTLITAAKSCLGYGAEEVYIFVTHLNGFRKLSNVLAKSPARRIYVSDSLYVPREMLSDKIVVMPLAPLLGEAIQRVDKNLSVSSLFQAA